MVIKQERLQTIQALMDASGSSRPTIMSWMKRDDFPKGLKSGGIPLSVWLPYAKNRQEDAKKKQSGKDADLKRTKLEKQIKILEIDIRKAEREDEMHKIEHEARRGLWFHVDQIKEFAALVASAFDDSIVAVEMTTRDASAVKATKETFDRIRTRLADKIE